MQFNTLTPYFKSADFPVEPLENIPYIAMFAVKVEHQFLGLYRVNYSTTPNCQTLSTFPEIQNCIIKLSCMLIHPLRPGQDSVGTEKPA